MRVSQGLEHAYKGTRVTLRGTNTLTPPIHSIGLCQERQVSAGLLIARKIPTALELKEFGSVYLTS